MPQVSVIIPVYKTEAYLRKCLDSVLAQTLQDLEVILVDEGSPDNSGRICDEYADKYPNIRVIHKENGGLLQARLSGIAVANGKYLTFVDSDDWIQPDMYLPMVEQAELHSADIVAVGFTRDFGSRLEPFSNVVPSGVYQKEDLEWLRETALFDVKTMTQALAPCVWAKLFRKELLLEVLSDRTVAVCFGEDALITYPALFKSKRVVVMNDRRSYRYQIREGSITNSYYKNYFSDICIVYDRIIAAAEPVMTERLSESIACYYIFLYLGCIGQEMGKGNPANITKRYRNLCSFSKDERLCRSLSLVKLSRYSRVDAYKLQFLSRGHVNCFLTVHWLCRVREKVKKLWNR